MSQRGLSLCLRPARQLPHLLVHPSDQIPEALLPGLQKLVRLLPPALGLLLHCHRDAQPRSTVVSVGFARVFLRASLLSSSCGTRGVGLCCGSRRERPDRVQAPSASGGDSAFRLPSMRTLNEASVTCGMTAQWPICCFLLAGSRVLLATPPPLFSSARSSTPSLPAAPPP
ncbi:unnamed protein product [Prorocentrum cordatum]|uniref:Uncharacterized protein n=1 Tax=Prorocentrum cordatum TaxID=2364126 RepID=A0ABN9TBT1_9DINO|nr:unnamed protein product [Polarella glacialis]